MANFVLVPGFWLGSWAWKEVISILRKNGHEVFSVTLTELGERNHPANKYIDFEMHVADVVNLIQDNRLENVYLAGHSYGGALITQIANCIPEKIAKLIYVDSAPLPDGISMIDFYQPEQRELFEKIAATKDDFVPLPTKDLPLSADTLRVLSDKDWERMQELTTAQPYKAAYQEFDQKNPPRRNLKKLAILCTFPLAQVKKLVESAAPRFQELSPAEFEFVELSAGLYPMFSHPVELTEILHKAAQT